MRFLGRRSFVGGYAATLGALLLETHEAQATLVRGLTLPMLVARSQHVLVLRPLESFCHFIALGGRRSLVTDTRVAVEEHVAKAVPAQSELLVRTLGGRLGGMGELVHGQAELAAGGISLAFLTPGPDGAQWVTGMAQGHYPVRGFGSAQARLSASGNLPSIVAWETSAVKLLAGKRLADARSEVKRLEAAR